MIAANNLPTLSSFFGPEFTATASNNNNSHSNTNMNDSESNLWLEDFVNAFADDAGGNQAFLNSSATEPNDVLLPNGCTLSSTAPSMTPSLQQFADFFKQQPMQSSGLGFMHNNHSNNNSNMFLQPQPAAVPTVDSQGASQFVNVVLMVDPTQQRVFAPQQVLYYKTSDNQVQTSLFGPTYFNDFPKEAMANLPLATDLPLQNFEPNPLGLSGTGGAPETDYQQFAVPDPLLNTTKEERDGGASLVSLPESVSSTYAQSNVNVFNPVLPSASVSPSTSRPLSLTSVRSGSPEGAVALPPLRALSAYNFFFRDERERILHGGDFEWTSDKQQRLLADHWLRDRTKKRRHRKTHGKIDFTTLSKLISQRWKDLPEDRKKFYREVATKDWERYQKELNEQKDITVQPLAQQAYQVMIG